MTTRKFSETQRFNQVWMWVATIAASSVPTILVSIEVFKGLLGWAYLPLALITSLLMVLIFRVINLKTTIDETGISFRLFLIHPWPVKKGWDEIEKAYVRKYSPLREYGGRGRRFSLSREGGVAYTISGNMGLQLVLKNGNKVLIGIRQPAAVSDLLSLLKQEGRISVNIAGETGA